MILLVVAEHESKVSVSCDGRQTWDDCVRVCVSVDLLCKLGLGVGGEGRARHEGDVHGDEREDVHVVLLRRP